MEDRRLIAAFKPLLITLSFRALRGRDQRQERRGIRSPAGARPREYAYPPSRLCLRVDRAPPPAAFDLGDDSYQGMPSEPALSEVEGHTASPAPTVEEPRFSAA